MKTFALKLSLFLAAVVALMLLAACGGSSSHTSASSNPSSPGTSSGTSSAPGSAPPSTGSGGSGTSGSSGSGPSSGSGSGSGSSGSGSSGSGSSGSGSGSGSGGSGSGSSGSGSGSGSGNSTGATQWLYSLEGTYLTPTNIEQFGVNNATGALTLAETTPGIMGQGEALATDPKSQFLFVGYSAVGDPQAGCVVASYSIGSSGQLTLADQEKITFNCDSIGG
ncbi:MAG TPA: hypothetical protein VE998_03885, partial [Terriglobales bacterium]|nr:hypothetical protein [Terriglobales bacterium]